jgi:predicted ATPase
LVTLTGPGGVGKTRLALQVAAQARAAFADVVRFVPLAAITDPDLVLPSIAQALGMVASDPRMLRERVRAFLREKRLLLVLDNFGQVVAAAPLLGDLLKACPGLKALATSRVPLRVSGERGVVAPPVRRRAGRSRPRRWAKPALARGRRPGGHPGR